MKTICQLPTSVLVIFFITLVILVNGCSKSDKANSDSNGQSAENLNIQPGESVGQVRNGMTLDQVIKIIGQPDRRSSYILEYTRFGFAVVANKEGVVRAVMCGDASGLTNSQLEKAFTGRTKEGIGMGSSREDVIKAYGETTNTIAPPLGQENLPGREVLVYENLGLTFSLADSRVHHIIVEFLIPKS
jgi:hypothetical protein